VKPSLRRDISRALATAAPGRAFTLAETARGHVLVRDPAGRAVAVVPGTAGDIRWLRNLRADIRRASRALPLSYCSRVNFPAYPFV